MDNLRTKTYNLLRKSEKYFKTDMVYLAKGGSWLTFGQIASAIITFLLAIAYANFLPKEIYGTYKYILSIAGILGAFTLTGMGTTVVRSVAQGFEGVLKSAFWTQLKWSVLMILISFFFAIYYFINDNYILAVSLLIIGAFSPIIQGASLYNSFLNGKKEFKIKAIYGVLRGLIPALFILITITLTNNPIVLIFIYFISTATINFYFYIRTIKKLRPNDKIDKNAINYGKHLSVMNILSTIAGNLDKILMWHFLGPSQLAIYSFALAIPNQLKGVFKNIPALAFPKFSEKPTSEIKKTLPGKLVKFLLLLSFIVIIYIITA
jgi:O-antigen/teichoic acid export membrane protein